MPRRPPGPASHRPKKHPLTPSLPPRIAGRSGQPGQPVFAQPQPSPDPAGFKDPVTDQKFQGIRKLEAVPQPRGGAVEPVLTLAQVYGSTGAATVAAIQQAGQIVFPSVGDTGALLVRRHNRLSRTRW
jgi:hypothetical protein